MSSAIDIASERIDTMLRTGHAEPAWFSATFLAQVSASQVDAVIAGLIKTLGAYQRVEFTPAKFVAHFANGTDDVLIQLDADNKIAGLIFKPPIMATSSIDDGLRALAQMPGTVSYVIIEEGRTERAALNPSEPLAVGSSFKLAVLNALADEITGGSRRWSDVVPLRKEWKSLPSGVLRTWPDNTPLTLATYAAEMISVSDNTAADALVRIVGPSALRQYGFRNDPFLTTREMFVLKSTPGADLRAAYLHAASPNERAAVLARVDAQPLPRIEQLLTSPDPSVEWHYSVRELCKLISRVSQLPLMSINPGVADPADFRSVAYKGGSDFGIINLTTMVTTKRGTPVCFSATINDASHPVDESALTSAYSTVLRHIATF
jgi:Beta-lactamase enzyme family